MPIIPQAPHEPTEQTRKLAESSSGLGLPHESIACLIGIDDKTLRKYYRSELDMGKAKANGQIAKTLYSKATAGDTTALIWWTKTQMRWSETVKQEITGADGEPLQGIQVTFVKPDANHS
jgi:predicted transcriptional regulator